MAKTEMTKNIEQALLAWSPAQIGDIRINKFRGQHTALEVVAECGTTQSGIVDAVRVSEYFGDIEYRHICRPAGWRKEGFRQSLTCELGHDAMKTLPTYCEQTSCKWNGITKMGTLMILLTCFEIKVSKSDFKSEHGHNFIGNMNFYAVPEEIYKEIEPLVPPDIGILVYLHQGQYVGLRTKRKPTFREMTHEEQKWLILSVMKRIRDMDYKTYRKWLDDRNNQSWL